jgi:hypothetical protein
MSSPEDGTGAEDPVVEEAEVIQDSVEPVDSADSGAEAAASSTDATDADATAPAAEDKAPAAEDKAPAAKPAKKAAASKTSKSTAKQSGASEATDKVPGAATKPSGPVERPRLKTRYDSEVRAQLVEALGLANVMEAPRLEKIVVNMGVGRATQQPSLIEGAVRDLGVITGQKPLVTRARRSIAGFKLREGQNIGVKVTMRGDRAWEFLDRLIAIVSSRSPSRGSATFAGCRHGRSTATATTPSG